MCANKVYSPTWDFKAVLITNNSTNASRSNLFVDLASNQPPFHSASLLTEGLIEKRLGAGKISEAPLDARGAQANGQGESAINLQSDLSSSQAEEIPYTGADTRDDAGRVPLDLSREAKLPEPPKSTDSGTPKAIDIPRPSQSDAWTTLVTGETDDGTLDWLEKELAKQKLVKDSSTSKGASEKKQKQAARPLSSCEKKRPPQKLISSEPGDNVVVHRGFGEFVLPQSAAIGQTRTSFPPLSNESYDLTTYGLDPKAHEIPPRRIAVDENKAPAVPADPAGVDGESHTLDENLSAGYGLIKKIGPPSVHANDATTEIKRMDPSTVYSNDAATDSVVSSDSLEFCTKCQKRHIKQGPPVTLDDRDTCRSMLPDWFPKERFERPWDVFTDLINRYVKASQMLEGTEDNPETKVPWNKEYHDPSPEWKEVGRFGGWWKCRIQGEEGESEVPIIEKNCQLCHRRKAANDRLLEKRVETPMEKMQSIEDWIGKYMKEEMVRDRAYVKARLETEGF